MMTPITLRTILAQTSFRAKEDDPLIQEINSRLKISITLEILNEFLDIASNRDLRAVDIKRLMEKRYPSLKKRHDNWSTQVLVLITTRVGEKLESPEEPIQPPAPRTNNITIATPSIVKISQFTKKIGQASPIRSVVDTYEEYKLNPHLKDKTKVLASIVLPKLKEALSSIVASSYHDLSKLNEIIDSFDGNKNLVGDIYRKLKTTKYTYEFEKLFDVLQMLNDNLFTENGLMFTTTEETHLEPANLINSIVPTEVIGRQKIRLPNGSDIPVYFCTKISDTFPIGYHSAGMIIINVDAIDSVSQILYKPIVINQPLSEDFLVNAEKIRQIALQKLPERKELLTVYVYDYVVEEVQHITDIQKDRIIASTHGRSKYDRSDFVSNVFQPQFARFFNGIIGSFDQSIRKDLITAFMEFSGAIARIAISREPSLAVYHLLLPLLIGETSHHSTSGNLAIYFANRGANPSRFEISNTDVLELFQALPNRELETATNNLLIGKSSVVNKGAEFALNRMLNGGFNTFAHKQIVF